MGRHMAGEDWAINVTGDVVEVFHMLAADGLHPRPAGRGVAGQKDAA